MAEIDKTLNEAPQGVEEEIVEETVTEDTPMEVEVEGEETVKHWSVAHGHRNRIR